MNKADKQPRRTDIAALLPDLNAGVFEQQLHVGAGGALTLYPNTQTSLELGAGAATGRTDGAHSL